MHAIITKVPQRYFLSATACRGFLCPQGFVGWQKFTATGDRGAVGKGCDQ